MARSKQKICEELEVILDETPTKFPKLNINTKLAPSYDFLHSSYNENTAYTIFNMTPSKLIKQSLAMHGAINPVLRRAPSLP